MLGTLGTQTVVKHHQHVLSEILRVPGRVERVLIHNEMDSLRSQSLRDQTGYQRRINLSSPVYKTILDVIRSASAPVTCVAIRAACPQYGNKVIHSALFNLSRNGTLEKGGEKFSYTYSIAK